MSGRAKARDWRRRRAFTRYIRNRTCEECKKYSRKTFYCAKWRKVLDQKKKACMYFSHRSGSRGRRRRVG